MNFIKNLFNPFRHLSTTYQIFHTIILVFIVTFHIHGQYSIESQRDRLAQYSGHWVSTISPNTDSILEIPQLKMISKISEDNNSLHVRVFILKDGRYELLLNELIGYDLASNSMFAAGHNNQGQFFTGKGKFSSEKIWNMADSDLMGNRTMDVTFEFRSFTDVCVEGHDLQGQSLWKTRYIKKNPKDKNLGVQLVSVHQDMLQNPKNVLTQLGRMGFSYVETFVYDEGLFYGMGPTEFKKEVEKAGMQFLGSMTFYDLPLEEDWDEAMLWWKKCIDDHKLAGVSYLSTSNNQIKDIKTIEQLKRYCEYYNAIGQLCKDNGLVFVFHNHADEFIRIDGIPVYDYLLENTHEDLVYFQSDLYWMHVGGADPTDYFRKYPKRFISWHVKDYQELGQSGEIDFETIFKYSETSGLKYIIAEVEDYNFPPLYSINRAWEYLYYEILK